MFSVCESVVVRIGQVRLKRVGDDFARVAVENGHLIPIPDREGHTRYVIAEKPRLRDAASWLAGFEDPPTEAIGRVNRAIAECDAD